MDDNMFMLRKPYESKTDFAVYVIVGTFLALLIAV